MINEREYKYRNNNILGVLVGVIIGSLAGAVTMLLLAPQSGEDTRLQIQKKGIELRARTTEIMGNTLEQVRLNANKIAIGGSKKLQELKHEGQSLVAEQLDNLVAAAKAGKTAVKNS